MKKMLNREMARRLDERAVTEYGIPGIVLMENAGRGVAEKLIATGAASPVAICCGKGNNGGDGFVIARHLDLGEIDVRVLLWADPADLLGDARANYEIATRSGIAIQVFSQATDLPAFASSLADANWIVDALLGTGVRGRARPPMDAVIDALNTAAAPKLAVDVPSGLDCDQGIVGPAVKAECTCTFVAAKPGFVVGEAARYVGHLHVLDIGAPRKLVDEMLAASEGSL